MKKQLLVSVLTLWAMGGYSQNAAGLQSTSAMVCDPVTTDYTQNFDDQTFYAPISSSCWTRAYGGSATTGYTSTDSDEWRAKHFLNDDNNSLAAAIRLETTAVKDWLISPTFDLSSGTSYAVSFDYAVTGFLNSNPSAMGSDDQVQFLISTDGGATWTVAHTWDSSNAPSNTSNSFSFDISSYDRSNMKFAFYATDGAVEDNINLDFFIDNFVVQETTPVQTSYCTPSFTEGCSLGDYVGSFSVPQTDFQDLGTECSDSSYDDRTGSDVGVVPIYIDHETNFTITHSWGGQHVKIWIDLNNDYVFDDTELVATALSDGYGASSITNGTIVVPASATMGTYRMRIATKNLSDPTPCDNDGHGEAQDYMVQFINYPTCFPPEEVTKTIVTSTSAKVVWSASTTPAGEGYDVYYSTEATAPANDVSLTADNSVSVEANQVEAMLTGLVPQTTYYVWVRAKCDSSDTSAWSEEYATFTTGCSAQDIEYSLDFNQLTEYANVNTACWTNAKGGDETTGYQEVGSSRWYTKHFLNNETNSIGVRVNLFSNNRKEWLISPLLNLTGEGLQLTFKYGLTENGETSSSAMGADDYVKLLISTDDGVTWTVLNTWDASNTPSNEENTYTQDLSSYANSSVRIAFYATDGATDDEEDYDFFIDDFVVTNTESTGTIQHELTSLSIYPNPVSDMLSITNDTAIDTVEMFDVNGRRLVNKKVNNASTTIDVSSLATGTYFVKVTTDDGKTTTQQVIVK